MVNTKESFLLVRNRYYNIGDIMSGGKFERPEIWNLSGQIERANVVCYRTERTERRVST